MTGAPWDIRASRCWTQLAVWLPSGALSLGVWLACAPSTVFADEGSPGVHAPRASAAEVGTRLTSGSTSADERSFARSGCPRSTRFWATVQGGLRERYCALLRAGRAVVWVEPSRAMRHLEDARELARGKLVLREELELDALRTLAAGDPSAAHALFSEIPPYEGSWDASRVETELGRARAAFVAGEPSLAGIAYSRALMHLDALVSAQERARAFVEAAILAVSERRFPEADAYLGAARAEGVPLLAPVIAASRLYVDFHRGTSLDELKRERTTLDRCASLGWILERQPPSRGGPGELLPVLPERYLRELAALSVLRSSVSEAEVALREAAQGGSEDREDEAREGER